MDKCPVCGYKEVVEGKPVHTIMNNYVNAKDPKKVICVNRFDDKFDTLDKDGNVTATWIKQGLPTPPVKEGSLPIVNRLEQLPPASPLADKPVVTLSSEVAKDVVPNPFANITPKASI